MFGILSEKIIHRFLSPHRLIASSSNRHLRFDVRVGIVILQREVLVLEVEDALDLGVDAHLRQRARVTGKLQLGLFHVVGVDVRVAEGVHEVLGLQPANLRHHHRQQGVGGDVEGHAEENVRAALVELARELSVVGVELEHRVARRQRHLIDIRWIPRAHDEPPRIGIALELLDEIGDLVDDTAVGGFPGAPLLAIDRAEVAVFVRPLVPNGDVVVVQVLDVRVAAQEPQQLVDDGAQMQLLGRQQGETLLQVKAHLVAENAVRPRTRAVGFIVTLIEDRAH